MNETKPTLPTNRNAIISLAIGILTIVSFCIGAAPIPFTGYVCFPASLMFGIAALASGLVSLKQIRSSQENGRTLALIGAWIGGLAISAALCIAGLAILFLPTLLALIRQIIK
jgi:hypothetical protein